MIEVGKMARQANGSVFARYGGSTVLATVCCAQERRENLDFVPVSVDYNERYYAAGKIPGGFLKREARPKDKEILVSRLIDRPMRPLFSKAFGREIQVVPMAISTDKINPPDILGMNAAFSAVMISDIPFDGPVAAVRVVRVPSDNAEASYIVNPSFAQIDSSDMEIIVAGGKQGICMVEGGAKQVSEAVMLEAIRIAESEIVRICDFMLEMQKKCGKTKMELPESWHKGDFPLASRIRELAVPKLEKACFEATKEQRHISIRAARGRNAGNDCPGTGVTRRCKGRRTGQCHAARHRKRTCTQGLYSKMGKRCDGRKTDEIRPITLETGHPARRTMALRCLRAAKHSRWALSRSAALPMNRLWTILTAIAVRALCCTTTFRPIRSVRQVASEPDGAKLGTGTLRSVRLKTSCPKKTRFPVHNARCIRNPRIQRLFFDGHRMQRLNGPDGCRCATQSARCRHCDGPD